MLKAREGIRYARGEDQSLDALRIKFNDYCPVQNIPFEENPFFTCVERAGLYPVEQDQISSYKLRASNLQYTYLCLF